MVIIRFEHIKTVQHNIENGITEPKLAITDDNTSVIVKTINGPEGNRVLFNEYYCYRMAILLEIPMPESGICLIDNTTEILNECVNDNQYGYGFYSTYINKAVPLVETIISKIKNRDDFYKIVLFDHIIFNPDRNAGNLLVQYYKKNILLKVIDHSHVFVNQAIWDANCLELAMKEKDYFSTRVLEENKYLYNMFFHNMKPSSGEFSEIKERFCTKISEGLLRSIIADMPKEWISSDKDVDALIKYTLYRIEHIDDICITILNYLDKGGISNATG